MNQDFRIKETHFVSRASFKKGGLDQNLSVNKLTSPLKKGRSLRTLDEKIEKILEILRKRGWKIGIMESCTGGAVANAITNIPGASDVFDEGKVTYSVESKIRAGVREEIIEKFGVYSMETAGEMATTSRSDFVLRMLNVGVGITGNLPGEVFVAVRINKKVESRKFKIESKNNNKIKARKEMKREVVERVMSIIIDNL